MLSRGSQKLRGGEKQGGKLEGDQIVHLQGWTAKPIEANQEPNGQKQKEKRSKADNVNVIYQ